MHHGKQLADMPHTPCCNSVQPYNIDPKDTMTAHRFHRILGIASSIEWPWLGWQTTRSVDDITILIVVKPWRGLDSQLKPVHRHLWRIDTRTNKK